MKHVLILVSLFLTFSIKAEISNISPRDLNDIKYFLERLIIEDDFAYPIFGSKPMALADFGLSTSYKVAIHKQLKNRLFVSRYKKLLNTFQRNIDELVFSDFVFLDKELGLFRNSVVLVLINKKNLLNVLHEHESIFKQEIGDSFTPESFLENLEKRKVSLAKAIHNNYGLLGIMLGYGIRNSMLFQEKAVAINEIEKRKGVLDKGSELYKNYQTINDQLGDFNEFEDISIIMPLHFLADTAHPETIELREIYKADQQKIAELMRQPNFMDKVFERLTQ